MSRYGKNPPRAVRVQEVVASVARSLKTPRLIESPEEAVIAIDEFIGDRASEVFLVVYINIKNRAIGYLEFSEGSPVGVGVHPQGVFREALIVNASAFITAHQHPSGDPTPSAEDRALWQRLDAAGQILGIPSLDHFVIGSERYYSASADHTARIRP